jgi:TonB family protein
MAPQLIETLTAERVRPDIPEVRARIRLEALFAPRARPGDPGQVIRPNRFDTDVLALPTLVEEPPRSPARAPERRGGGPTPGPRLPASSSALALAAPPGAASVSSTAGELLGPPALLEGGGHAPSLAGGAARALIGAHDRGAQLPSSRGELDPPPVGPPRWAQNELFLLPERNAEAPSPADTGKGSPLARLSGGYQRIPEYPPAARRRGAQGETLLRVEVLRSGRVATVLIERSAGHADLDRAAVETVKTWRFDPPDLTPDAVSVWALLPVRWELR